MPSAHTDPIRLMRFIEGDSVRRTTFSDRERMHYLDLRTVLTVAAAIAVSSLAYLQIASEPEVRTEVEIDVKGAPVNGAVHESGASAAAGRP